MTNQNQRKQESLFNDISEVFDTINFILFNIVEYSSKIPERTPSIFDTFPQNNIDLTLSTTNSSSFSESSEDNFQLNEIITYDLNNFIRAFAFKFQFNDNLLILSLMNIDKILAKNFIITENNIKNLFLISMIETQKFYEDESFGNNLYAKFARINTNQLLEMEIEFLEIIDYKIFVPEEKFFNYKERMAKLFKKEFE